MRSSYNRRFYHHERESSIRSAKVILPFVFGLIHPSSVVDVGCGVGAWLSVAKSLGVRRVLGVDGKWAQLQDDFMLSDSEFQSADLSKPLRANGEFDLAVSLEVGEHLPDSSSQYLVDSLVSLGDVVLFSAAIPGQGGTNHINEQWPSYWARKFLKHGYLPFDFRVDFWENDKVDYFYRQNILMYANGEKVSYFPGLADLKCEGDPLPLVHPITLSQMVDPRSIQMKIVARSLLFIPKRVLEKLTGSE